MAYLRLTRIVPTVLAALACLLAVSSLAAELLRVCATVPGLGSLAEEVGGTEVAVTVFTKGTESPPLHGSQAQLREGAERLRRLCPGWPRTGNRLGAGAAAKRP